MIETIIILFMIAATIIMLIELILSISMVLTDKFNITIPNWFLKLLCGKCLSFWIVLILTGNILFAGTTSLFAYFIDKNI